MSEASTSSRLSQFGLYRNFDARTLEFLQLSKRRQIKQGCVCAAISTTITVIVVVVILLIYEYAIAVESSLVQRRFNKYKNDSNETDNPVADRLNRGYFGFDQDYFERMPLLVNAMQENSFIDPAEEGAPKINKAKYVITNYTRPSKSLKFINKHTTTLDYRINGIRRTSPRPFNFELKHPTPAPFSKTYNSRSWIENYRNAQRLKNIQHLIHYLEKTINAKAANMYAVPSSTHIAFSGVYVEPGTGGKSNMPKPTPPTVDLLLQPSTVESFKSNHQVDPLYSYKPESPGEVNLLADGFFRFSPGQTHSFGRDNNVPMFRQISLRNKNCVGIICDENNSKSTDLLASGEQKSTDPAPFEKTKSFSVMLNLFSLRSTDVSHLDSAESTQRPLTRLFITTSRPVVKFRRRSTVPIRRTTTRFKRPRMSSENKRFIPKLREDRQSSEPNMVVHVNVYTPPENKSPDHISTENDIFTTTHRYVTEMPILTSTQVEDYHVGSSGIIPVGPRSTSAAPPPISPVPTLPTVATMIPFFEETSTTEMNSWSTNPPEIVKFSQEDAKVPEQYKNLLNWSNKRDKQPDINRRNSMDNIAIKLQENDESVETRTLVVKLKNDIETTTKEENETFLDETTTIRTYVPQINGHYRSVNQNSRNINNWLASTTESDRKKRLEMSVSGFRKPTYVPQYVEIKRNNTKTYNIEHEDEDDE